MRRKSCLVHAGLQNLVNTFASCGAGRQQPSPKVAKDCAKKVATKSLKGSGVASSEKCAKKVAIKKFAKMWMISSAQDVINHSEM